MRPPTLMKSGPPRWDRVRQNFKVSGLTARSPAAARGVSKEGSILSQLFSIVFLRFRLLRVCFLWLCVLRLCFGRVLVELDPERTPNFIHRLSPVIQFTICLRRLHAPQDVSGVLPLAREQFELLS